MASRPRQHEALPVSFRLREPLLRRLRKASESSKSGPRMSQTAIVERGIELVLQELEDANANALADAARRTNRK